MDNFISKTETNNAKGIQHTLDYLSQFNVALITLEATGGLEIPVAKALARAGYRVFIANPLKASEFAKSQTRAKFALNLFLKPFTPDWLQKAKRRKRF